MKHCMQIDDEVPSKVIRSNDRALYLPVLLTSLAGFSVGLTSLLLVVL